MTNDTKNDEAIHIVIEEKLMRIYKYAWISFIPIDSLKASRMKT